MTAAPLAQTTAAVFDAYGTLFDVTSAAKAVWVNRGTAPRERAPGAIAAEIPSLDALPELQGL